MRTNSTQVDKACCSLPNQNIVVVQDGISTPHCHLFQEPEDLESFLKSINSVETFKSWYELCFEPMQPPQINWQELLPSLLVYSLTFALGVSGNILIILTVKRKSSFKSPTNTFLASLATTDLLLIVLCLPT